MSSVNTNEDVKSYRCLQQAHTGSESPDRGVKRTCIKCRAMPLWSVHLQSTQSEDFDTKKTHGQSQASLVWDLVG